MASPEADSALFEELTRDLLKQGISVRFTARGASMSPAIRGGETVLVTPVIVSKLRKGDIVLTKSNYGFRLHRLVIADLANNLFVTRGDCGLENDEPVSGNQILGIAPAKEVRVGRKVVMANFNGIGGRSLRAIARAQYLANKLLRAVTDRSQTAKCLSLLLLLLLAASAVHAQAVPVAVDSASSGNAELTGNATRNLTVAHTTTTTGTNLLMLVGVSLNITNATTTTVTGVKYNGVALTLLGAHNDAGNTRQVEMWYLLNPSTGTNNAVVSVRIPSNNTVGVVAGVMTFTGVDQTVPLGSFNSADGAGAGNSQMDIPSVINGMILDTLAIGGPETVTVPGPQVSQWNQNTTGRFGSDNDPPDVTGSGSTRSGAPSVPISESFSANSNWSEGAVSINPTSADIGVSTSVQSAVFLGANTTYTITVSNSGPSTANSVSLSDTIASGMALSSVVTSTGSCITTSNPITCSLGNMASGATATITVVATGSAAGAYSNVATVSDSGTPPDPNTGNNTYTAVATVQSIACGVTTQAVAGTNLSGVLNTYYPGTASVAAGTNSIPVGTPTGAGAAIASGSLLLVIQMQDAGINDSNSVNYGNGYTGQGFNALNSAGNYEFVTATSAVSGGAVTIAGAGASGGLVSSYHASAWSATAGQSSYQVIVVPQYTTASFSAATPPTALAWNGSTGGVLVVDASSTLTLNGATISMDGMGFRGGAGMQLTGLAGASVADFLHSAPGTYTGAEAGVDAVKGEGIAGTPLWVESGGTYLNTASGYPSGTAGTDGSSARGAPGNAGGGGTDGDPNANDQNAGGGGGSNGGAGGFGGDSWNSNLSVGGEGGVAFPATINRIAMGGGGGAGTRNNSDGDTKASSGSAGGGIIILRANALSGTGTLTANGSAAYIGTANDSGGGAGAGGTVVLLSANGGESGVSVQVNGGRGGDAWDAQTYSLGNRHGPGGGGGGGAVFTSGPLASVQLNGGANGTTLNPGVAYGATPGASGTQATATITQTSGTLSGAQCTPDMTIGKSHVGNFTRGLSASYTLAVENVSIYGSSTGTVIVNDTLPSGLTPTGATGSGWSCGVASQTVSCTRGDSLAGGNSFYPSITVNAAVSQSAAASVSNTAIVGGGGEINLTNDAATDVANIGSSADLSVTNSGTPNPVTAGQLISYTQTVTNSGPSAADNATFVATVPANSVFESIAAPTGWSCITPVVGTTGNVVCTNVNMAGSTSATFTLIDKVNAGVANGTVITETASVSSSASDPNSSNNTASVATLVGTTAQAEMVVTNSASPNPVVAGSTITYTQTATNVGSAAANTPQLTENTPANTTFFSISYPVGTSCTTPAVGAAGAITCTGTTAPAGTSGTVVVTVKVNAGTASGTVITDTVTVNSTNQAFGANSATATDVVASSAAQADLALATVATPSPVYAGNGITYTQTVTNNGPGTASTITFTEPVPTNTTSATVSAPAGWACTVTATITCTTASLASGASADIIVAVTVPSTVTAASITATSSIAETGATDPNSANNSTTTVTPVSTTCDLSVTNSGTPSPVTAGSNITYTQVITNTGPSNCSTGSFTEATPANTTFQSVAVVNSGGGTWTCPNTAPVACSSATVAPGATATITAIYKVSGGATAGTLITDTVNATTATRDSDQANNTATVTIGVAGATQADLSLTNAGAPNPVGAPGTITFTQVVTNSGPASSTGVVLTETLPAGTTFSSLTGTGCTTTPPYTCSLGTIAKNGTATVRFVVNVPATATSGTIITDTASVAATTADPNSTNNTASSSVVVSASADLGVTNAANPVPVQAGNNITYTQVVNNAGPAAATSAVLTEITPANTVFQSIAWPAGWSCTTPAVGTAGTITCNDPSFATGSGSFTVVLKVNAGTASGTSISDTAAVSSSTSDPNSANNTATANDVVATATQADLVVTNTALPTSVSAGSNVTYTQVLTNSGPAAANNPATFTENIPPNMTYQGITIPPGWLCNTLTVGGTTPITCTNASFAANSSSTFTVVLQVASGTTSGTNIADTVTLKSSNDVADVTATAIIIVADANSADLAIVKTAAPNPVLEGDPLTYTLAVTNNGPATATNVTATDMLPSVLTYLQSTPSQGTCSEAGGAVTCQFGTIPSGTTVNAFIVTIPGAPGMVTNTANVSTPDETDPNLSNNTSSWTETIIASTKIRLQSFSAQTGLDKNGKTRTLITWKTGAEAHNLGFNLYREENGERVRLNPSLIGGSALLMHGALPKHAGRTYAWIDTNASAGSYWLEDVDVNGTRTMHGPTNVDSSESALPQMANSRLLNQMKQSAPEEAAAASQSHGVETQPQLQLPTTSQIQQQFQLAAHPAVKILVDHEGWYRVTQPQLVQAGLDPNADPTTLCLFAEAVEQPMQITGAGSGRGSFGPQAALNFYGTGIDTIYSGTRVYWLVGGEGRGSRIAQLQPSSNSNVPPQSFPATVELRQRTTYFAALLTPNGDNFFGAFFANEPVNQTMQVIHLDTAATTQARLEIVLQGVIAAIPHDVTVVLNGTTLGDVTYTGQDKGRAQFEIPPGVLLEGANTVTLTAQNGDYDTNLVDYIRVAYPHQYVADADQLKFTGDAGDEISIGGFSTASVTVLDITDPAQPVQIAAAAKAENGRYSVNIQVPWTTTSPKNPQRHTLLAVAADSVASASVIEPNHPSHWHSNLAGADIAMVTHEAFASALAPLVQEHAKSGKSSAVVLIGDLYDEFNFGERSPFVIRQFLQAANANWRTAPKYLLLNGRASLDPRNYLGFGFLDFVPTKIVPTSSLETASDDWFSDFTNNGMPTVATGRLPVATADDATNVIGKITNYESAATDGPWTSQALMVADRDDTESFSQDLQTVQKQIPSSMTATDVLTGTVGGSTARQDIINGINSGQLLVSYLGHGAENQWSGDDIFDDSAVASLTNNNELPVFLIMDCLNGFFQDVYEESLAVSLMLAPNSGGVAALASTGLNQPAPQTKLATLVVQGMLNASRPTLGETVLKAKSHIGDPAVRRTFVLFGDPAMQVKQPNASASSPAN